MEWGTYKPNLFFAVKQRVAVPVTVGLVWVVNDRVRKQIGIRHTYKFQSGDGVTAYFEYHDGWSSAREIIEDPSSNARFEIDFLKSVSQDQDGSFTSQWKVMIDMKRIDTSKQIGALPFIYISYEKRRMVAQQITEKNGDKTQTKIVKIMKQADGPDEYEYFEVKSLNEVENTITSFGLDVHGVPLWNLEEIFKMNFQNLTTQGSTEIQKNANLIIIRMPYLAEQDQKFIVSYNKRQYLSENDASRDSILMNESPMETIENFEFLKGLRRQSFNNKFEYIFKLNQEKFEKDKILNDFKDHGLQFSKEALSNLLGGIGYYYGPIQIKSSKGKHYDEPAGLFTGCPARSRFPRGFLWDEGFHLILTCQWSKFLCQDIIQHWFTVMKPNGWIPREQIRGAEAESVVPAEFIVQDPKLANPPSMLFALKHLISQANKGDQKMKSFLAGIFSKWQKWYEWFFKSQENRGLPNTFSWRGRTPDENMPSGLDDYPRGYIVNEGYEIHLDLQSWMVEFSSTMGDYAKLMGEDSKANLYFDKSQSIKDELQNKLYNYNIKLYCDYVGTQWEPKVSANGALAEPIEWRTDTACGASFESSLKLPSKCNHPYSNDEARNHARCCKFSQCVYDPKCECPNCQSHISIDDDYNALLLNQFSLHLGIVNFYPIMFGIIDDEDRVKNSLKALADESTMLSKAGIRSLSKKDQFYQYRSNYWRGAVWINVNYLALRGIYNNYLSVRDFTYDIDESTSISSTGITNAVDLYNEIRQRLIRTIYQNWRINHIFWEQYNDETTLGQITNPFTGWTTLILLIVSENYA